MSFCVRSDFAANCTQYTCLSVFGLTSQLTVHSARGLFVFSLTSFPVNCSKWKCLSVFNLTLQITVYSAGDLLCCCSIWRRHQVHKVYVSFCVQSDFAIKCAKDRCLFVFSLTSHHLSVTQAHPAVIEFYLWPPLPPVHSAVIEYRRRRNAATCI